MIPLHLLSLLRRVIHCVHHRIVLQLLLAQQLETRMLLQLATVPVRQVLHVCDCVQDAALLQVVHVLREQHLTAGEQKQQLLRNDATTVILLLEVRVGEAEEHLAQLTLADKVRQVLHGVRPHHRHILILRVNEKEHDHLSRILLPQILDTQVHVLGHLHTNLQTQNQLIG